VVKLTKIYTRTGDDGTTGLVGGLRRAKHDRRIEAFGTVDEANAVIGLARLQLGGAPEAMLGRIQQDMFDLGADLATPYQDTKKEDLRIIPTQVGWLEQQIDALNAGLKPLASFILPGGSPAAAALHLARTVVRRAERLTCGLAVDETVNPEAIKYLNRLSDFLFVLARTANGQGDNDVLWQPGVNR
jgi:cob(I)alamin adenosyltransferase